ncbi:YafY family transcriptional regulator [Kitasatospora sp. NBC_01287]|uniref:helix-turn-helix transcriptional regulator n=1 Tax=Kitasatospora sp. NBC_01287 TaxID=2903573 RepID=UPI00224F0268|nr:YafY family protein [Kitasatospora sp. NBC_01287]MCX4749033.1 YafY family transcriptional regulator [Kitasatospora sp. NBC_01287]
MLETSARLLRLLSLLQARRDWSGADLAVRLGVGVRTVRRDVEKLRALDYPVDSTPGAAGGYRLGAGAEMPPLLLDDEEAVAVAVGLRMAANGSVAGIEETSVRALAKLQQVLPARLRGRVESIAGATTKLRNRGPAVDATTLAVIAAACLAHERLRFEYTAKDGAGTRRDVEPCRLVHTGTRWYLAAWDIDRADWRNFRVDRMRLRPPHGPRFTPRERPEQDIGDFLSWEVAVGRYRYQARFTVHAPAARVAEWIGPTDGLVEPLTADSCTVRTGSNSLNGLALHIGLLGLPFTVHEPRELVEHIAALAQRLGRATEPADRSANGAAGRFET